MPPVAIQYSDLQLLHDLFCRTAESFDVFDPHKRLSQNIKTITKKGSDCQFNLSANGYHGQKAMKFYFGKNRWEKGKKFIYINNPDGTMRWLIPAANHEPSHLALYNAESLKARIYKSVSRLLFRAGLGKWLGTSAFYVEQNLEKDVKRLYRIHDDEQYVVFTGTRGNNRKVVLAISNGAIVTHFIKIPISKKSQELIENETNMLKQLSKYDFTTLSIPRVTDSRIKAYTRLTNVKPATTISAQRINDIHIRALTEIYSFSHERKAIAECAAWQTVVNNMEWMQREHTLSNGLDEFKARRVLHLLNKLYHTLNTGEAIPVSVSHGDFTPWNMYCDENRLYVYDWELSENGIPMLFDLYHFIFQSQVMVQHQNYTNIRQSIKDTVKKHNVQRLVNKYRIDTGLHYQLYLMFNISYYMRLYIEEKELLTQSHWMVDAWMDALEDVNKVK